MLIIISHQESANQNQSETPLQTLWADYSHKSGEERFGEDIRKLEPSYIACKTVKSYSHGRRQFGSSSKSLT